MGGLFSSLNVGADALRAYTRALQTVQNNVSNASTPGYVKQAPTLEARSQQLNFGLAGGVTAGDPQSARNEYLEQAVRTQAELGGNFSAQSQALSSIEQVFDITGQSGVAGALNKLFQSFSAWAASPDSSAARQNVLAKAQDVSIGFQQAASALSSATTRIDGQISSTVQQINALASQLRDENVQRRRTTGPDAGLDAKIHATLEDLSGLADVSARFESDGTVTLLLGGQTPLVLGDRLYQIQASSTAVPNPANPNATPATTILDAQGADITSLIGSGTLGGLLTVRNSVLPSLQGDGQQAGVLNQLAKQVADRVNQILQSGQSSAGQPGIALFSYDASSGARIAYSLGVSPNATADSLAPVDPTPPAVSNGIALRLASLGDSTDPQDSIAGQSILGFYSVSAATVGHAAANASARSDGAIQSLNQARAFRNTVSGVSLDEEAIRVIELQRGFQAASKLIGTVDSLTDSLMNMIR